MNYNFDEVIDRRGTCSEKVDGMVNAVSYTHLTLPTKA